MNQSSEQFIGVGWKFPVEFSRRTNGVVMLSGEEDIRNSLEVLFATGMGERIMQPDYGSELHEFVFDNLSKSTMTYMQAVISDAILFYEPRIILNEVEIDPRPDDPSFIDIRIAYTVSATNNRYNYVYPYYLKEGTNLAR